VYYAPPPPTTTVVVDPLGAASYWDGVWSGRAEAFSVAALASHVYMKVKEAGAETEEEQEAEAVDFTAELRETRQLMRELKAELAGSNDPLADVIERPPDGTYVGESAEDDDGDQAVETTLIFGRDGAVTGEGHDGADGAYVVSEGQWSGKRVAWLEQYDEGFTVALRGQVRPDGTILALWASSRGIGGSAELCAPKVARRGA